MSFIYVLPQIVKMMNVNYVCILNLMSIVICLVVILVFSAKNVNQLRRRKRMKIVKFDKIRKIHKKMVVAGAGKAGKTFFSVAHPYRTLFLSTELNQANLAIDAAVQIGRCKAENISTVDVTSLGILEEALEWAGKNLSEFDILVIDNLTGVEEMITDKISDADKKDTFKFYRILGQSMRKIIQAISAIPCHQVVIVHTKEQSNENSQQMLRLNLGGNIAKNELRKSFNLIGYMKKERLKNELLRKIVFEDSSLTLNFIGGHPNLAHKETADLTAIFNKIDGRK